ncbi:MAG TPA: NAD(P)-dependent oxidoreductase [Ardenticatenaceae bacterium]|nr:NAD(P)-dependent oxidoreductase [Ardenticatenaceae bacterium]
MERVALIGLGLMGAGMGHNLLRAGVPLTVYNRTREKAAPLEEAGARVAATPREAAEGADVVLSMVADDDASRAVWLGTDGALRGVRHGGLLVEHSTLSTAWVRELAELAGARGCGFLDAPVLGSKPQAEGGELVFLVGGEAAALERARPLFEAMGRRTDHMGPAGSGATMKLINNLMGGVQIAVLAEGLVLAERAGLDLQKVLFVLLNGAPGSPSVKNPAAAIAGRDYETLFALRWMHKDLSYALEEAVHQVVPLPTVAAARESYRLAMARGLGDDDFSAVAEALRPS